MMHVKAPHCHPLSPGLATGTLAASCQGQKWQQLCVQNVPVGGLAPPYFSVQPLAYVIPISPSEALRTGSVSGAPAFARTILAFCTCARILLECEKGAPLGFVT